MARLCGDRRTWTLADPRLEALRRFAILFRHQGPALAGAERCRLADAGFDVDQIHEVEDMIEVLNGLSATAPRAGRCIAPLHVPSNEDGPGEQGGAPVGDDPVQQARHAWSLIRSLRFGIAAACVIAMPPPAFAKDRTSPARQVTEAIMSAATEPPSRNHVILGVGAAYLPAYQGSRDYRLFPLPAIDIVHGALFANLRDGISVRVIDTGKVQFGLGAAPVQGYRAREVPRGIGDLSFGLGMRLSANVALDGAIVSAGVTKGLAFGNKGLIADVGVAYPVSLSPRLTIVPALATNWTDARYGNRYFGVSAQQSRAFGLSAYRLSSGFNDASATLSANYLLTSRIIVAASAGVSTLLGGNRDSPLVHRRTQPSGFLSIGYRL